MPCRVVVTAPHRTVESVRTADESFRAQEEIALEEGTRWSPGQPPVGAEPPRKEL